MERAPAGATYNVGGGEEATMLEAIAVLENVSGRALQTRHRETAKGDMARTKADISRIGAELAWQPRTSLRDGLAAMWSWTAARVAAG
jgi:nucleoside-diphosphate-sugar epimerase